MNTRPIHWLPAFILVLSFVTLAWLGNFTIATDLSTPRLDSRSLAKSNSLPSLNRSQQNKIASSGFALPNAKPQPKKISGSNQITITESGFSPTVLTVTVGAQVTWLNATLMTQWLESGNPSFSIFLPAIQKEQASGNNPIPATRPPSGRTAPSRPRGVSFSVVLAPGGMFSYVFDSIGEFPYFLANACCVTST